MPLSVEPEALAQRATSPRIVREPRIAERVLFVGGHPGCGKTMMTPIVGSFDRVEVQKFNYTIEHLGALSLLGRIDDDVAVALVRMLTDLDVYHLAMARETNFRPSDLSSVFRNPNPWRYLRRLVQAGDAEALARIRRERPILQLTTHNALALCPLLMRALDERVRVLEVVRHPLYMIKQWYAYIDRYGADPREFTIWFDYAGRALPFFAWGWEARYLASSAMDRVIYAIERLSELGRLAVESLAPERRAQVLVVPFERFVLEPWPWLARLEALLGTTRTPWTRQELKRQRVPRRRVADGIDRSIYKQYGWEPADRDGDERRELEKRRQFVQPLATQEALAALDRLCAEYERTYLDGAMR